MAGIISKKQEEVKLGECRMPKTNSTNTNTDTNTEIEYETLGDPTSKPLLLIAGLGSQMYAWSDEMCNALVKEGFFVIRFDNRDVGLSTKFGDAGIPDFTELSAAIARGEEPNVPYTLYDLVDDVVGILDALNIQKAHICGASMGGLIAQAFAHRHVSRVLSLAIIMSTTGNPELPPGKPEILMEFFAPIPSEREAYINEAVRRDGLIYGSFAYDEIQGKYFRTKEYDRSFYPEGAIRQLAALYIPGNIQPEISKIRTPTVVIHGSDDPFYPPEVGKIIAETIPGAELLIIEGMGHSFPREVVPRIIDAIVKNSLRLSRFPLSNNHIKI